MKRRISHIISLLVAALLLVVPREATAQQVAKELARLDQTLEMSHTYVDVHNRNIQELNDALSKPSISLERRYEILCSLYDAYRSFQFDRAIEILDERDATWTAWEKATIARQQHLSIFSK